MSAKMKPSLASAKRWLKLLFISTVIMQSLTVSARSDYVIAAGDLIELSVAGVPELKQRYLVGADGSVSFAPLGRIEVRGLSLVDLQTKIQEALLKKVYYQTNSAGRDSRVTLDKDSIIVTVAEYRPVYISGNVAKPGEQPYRPGMTIRQALVVAGGLELLPNRAANPLLQAVDVRSEHEVLSVELEREQAYINRLRAEMRTLDEPTDSGAGDASLDPQRNTTVAELQAHQLIIRNSQYHNERSYLEVAIHQSAKRIGVLSEQQDKEHKGEQADAEDLARVEALFQKGAVPITRITEARRIGLLSATRRLETAAQIAHVERERHDFQRRLQKLDDDRRFELLKELDQANLKQAAIRSRLQAAAEKSLYTGAINSHLPALGSREADFLIMRRRGDEEIEIAAGAGTELSPGDVVDVTLRMDFATRILKGQ